MAHERCFGILGLKKDPEWKILILLHRSGDYWGFPKGHGEPHENGIDAAKRELKEETALIVSEILSEDPLIERYSFERDGQKIDKTVYFYPALIHGTIQLQHKEIQRAEWVTLDQAAEKLSFEEARKLIPRLKAFLLQWGL